MRNTLVSRSVIKNPAAYVYPHIECNGVDLTSRANHIVLSSDIDTHGWTAEVQFINHPDLEDLTPWSGSSYSDVLKPDKVIKVWLRATLTKGEYSGDRDLVFEGRLGDDIVCGRNVNRDDVVAVRCRSKLKKLLQDIYVLDDFVYPVGARGANPWEVGDENYYESATAVAQQILNEHVPSPPTLRVLHDPNYSVYPYTIGEENIWEILQNLFLATGYVLEERYWSATDAFELVLFDPLQVGGADSLDANNYSVVSRSFSDSDRRTKVRVYYRSRTPEADKAAGAQEPPYAPEGVLYVEKSIAAPVPRAMKVVEDETSLIDTYAEADAFATMILNELKYYTAQVSIECPGALYYLEPYDTLTLSGPVSGTVTVTGITITITRQRGSIKNTTQINGVMEIE
ncbi:MAG: hypothetical protein QW793_04975 [Candidatus Caldarchaeum sp.]